MISESDWEKFKTIRSNALDRLCSLAMNDFKEALSDEKLTSHGKYLCLYKLVENYDKRISLLFDGQSRSRAQLQMLLFRSENLVTAEEIDSFSEQFKQQTKPKQDA